MNHFPELRQFLVSFVAGYLLSDVSSSIGARYVLGIVGIVWIIVWRLEKRASAYPSLKAYFLEKWPAMVVGSIIGIISGFLTAHHGIL